MPGVKGQKSMCVRYARKELTTDPVLKKLSPGTKRFDVVIYKDKRATKRYATFPWHYKSKPRKNTKNITINNQKCTLIWLPDKERRRG